LHLDHHWQREALQINERYLNYYTEIKLNSLLKTEQNALTGLINTFVKEGGNYAIKSRMGTGKTQLLKKIIQTHFMDKKILYLSHRQTFTHNIVGSFKELGFTSYLETKRCLLDFEQRLV